MHVQCTCSECGASFTRQASNLRTTTPCCSRKCQNVRIGKLAAGRAKKPRAMPIISDDNLTARIALYGGGERIVAYTIVDATDAEWANQWRWRRDKERSAIRVHNHDGAVCTVYLHRELLGLPHYRDVLVGDHMDRDPLNNRRSNLRAITQGGNMQNVTAHSVSGYRGVTFIQSTGRWRAKVKTGGKMYHFGVFSTAEEAAEAARVGRAKLLPFAVN